MNFWQKYKPFTELAISLAKKEGASYADIRIIESQGQSIATKNEDLNSINEYVNAGFGIRVIYNGGWGFASSNVLSNESIAKTVELAISIGKASSLFKEKISLAPEPIHVTSYTSPCKTDPFSIPLERKINELITASELALNVKGITLTLGHMHFIKAKQIFASLEGSYIEQTFIKSSGGLDVHATKDGDQQNRSYPNSFGGQWELAGYELIERLDLKSHAAKIANQAVELLTAKPCPTGNRDIIIGSSQLGLQIHESCGHPSELDRALGEEINYAGDSFLKLALLNKLKYGSPIINLFADATIPHGLGSFGFDDEGVMAQKFYLVKDGIFCNYLASRELAGSIGLKRSNGCMRSQSWNYTPIIRMTNICLEPGRDKLSLDDLIGDTKDGIYMETNKSWSIDQKRYNFQFSTQIAWEIKDGKLGQILKNPSYGGITSEFWNSCDAICDDSEYIVWGVPNCGKGQPSQTMWTGHGASPARFKNIKVGIAHKV